MSSYPGSKTNASMVDTMNSTSTEGGMPSAQRNDFLIPLIAVLSIVVLALTIVLMVIFCRRRSRKKERNEDCEVAIKAMRSTESRPNLFLDNEKNNCFSNSVVSEVSLETKALKPDEFSTKPDTPSPDIYCSDSINLFNTNTDKKAKDENVAPIPVTARSQENITPVALRHQQNITPVPVTPRPQETLNSACDRKTGVSSMPALTRARGHSKDMGQANSVSMIVDNKDATLRRASQLFRSDTRAYEFYTKTIVNYEMKRDHLKPTKVIGKGHFGCVHIGDATKIPNTKQKNVKVAVKTLKSSAPDSEKQEFLYELEIMRLVNSLNHPNIIKLLGCVTKSQPYLIVLELMANGNLQRFLRDTKSGDVYYNLHGQSDSLTEHHLLKFALDIARGMEGIADLQLLHRDLAARNILIDESLTCKVADFGFAKDVLNKAEYRSKSVFQRPRPTRWLPPESLFTFKHCIESDVWSYGIVLWEIVTLGNLPYPNMSTREVMKAIAKEYRMPCPYHCSPDLYKIMAECWQEKPHNRPSFTQIVNKIQELQSQAHDKDMIDMKKLHEDDYIDSLPPEAQEIMIDYAASETLC